MISSATIDTNILIYSIDAAESTKNRISLRILEAMIRSRSPLPMQCLSEFYSVTTRKRLLTQQDARFVVEESLNTLRIVAPEIGDLVLAMSLHQKHLLQFFDCLLIATAARDRCSILFTEDMQDGSVIAGVTICNPFIKSAMELDALLA